MIASEALRRGVVATAVAVLLALPLGGCSGGAAARGSGAPATPSPIAPAPTVRADGSDDTTSSAFLRLNAHQQTLERFDDWVRAQPGVYRHGYIASVDDLEHTAVTLLWHGTDPWRYRLVAAGPRFGVTVRFQQRAQSLHAFTAMQHRLEDAAPRFEAMGFGLSTISGIGATPQPVRMEGHFRRHADRAAVQRLATEVAGEPVQVREGGVDTGQPGHD